MFAFMQQVTEAKLNNLKLHRDILSKGSIPGVVIPEHKLDSFAFRVWFEGTKYGLSISNSPDSSTPEAALLFGDQKEAEVCYRRHLGYGCDDDDQTDGIVRLDQTEVIPEIIRVRDLIKDPQFESKIATKRSRSRSPTGKEQQPSLRSRSPTKETKHQEEEDVSQVDPILASISQFHEGSTFQQVVDGGGGVPPSRPVTTVPKAMRIAHTPLHAHPLEYTAIARRLCDGCRASIKTTKSWYCKQCGFDLCEKCLDRAEGGGDDTSASNDDNSIPSRPRLVYEPGMK